MPFVAAKCKQCGHNMQVDESLEKGFCPACGTPYVKEDVVNNYNTYNTTNYQIENSNVIITDTSSIEKRLENAEVFLTVHHDYDKAAKIFTNVTEDAPADYRGWWGLVRVCTFNLDHLAYLKANSNGVISNHILNLYQRAINVIPDADKSNLQRTWEQFVTRYSSCYNKKITDEEKHQQEVIHKQKEEKSQKIDELNSKIAILTQKISDIDKIIEDNEQEYENNKKLQGKYFFFWIAILLVVALLASIASELQFVIYFVVLIGAILLFCTLKKNLAQQEKRINDINQRDDFQKQINDMQTQIQRLS